ncbi:UNKNOWN [Stylonychia lemnae]|uniref:Uncharacterized protein n=1 Tax=Stylonychia lemnae TaxID=5949 RepID=A0A078B933_STYLE|nr:UNKNOWN [Stylonychia lemnae]|eukprot:CDW89787.1 UNKNOWN [Stylonychia lemnae]
MKGRQLKPLGQQILNKDLNDINPPKKHRVSSSVAEHRVRFKKEYTMEQLATETIRQDELDMTVNNIYQRNEEKLNQKKSILKQTIQQKEFSILNEGSPAGRLGKLSRRYRKASDEIKEDDSNGITSTLNINAHNLNYFEDDNLELPHIGGNQGNQAVDNDEKKKEIAKQMFRNKKENSIPIEGMNLKVDPNWLKRELDIFQQQNLNQSYDFSDDEYFEMGQKMDLDPKLLLRFPGQLIVRSTYDVGDINKTNEANSKSSLFDVTQGDDEKMKFTDQANYEYVLKQRQKSGDPREISAKKDIDRLQSKLNAYAQQIEHDVDNNFKTTTEKINYLKNLSKTPLQRYFNEIKDKKYMLTKEILEFDKKFFQNQLNKIIKAYQVEIRTQQYKAKEKAIEYVEYSLTRGKQLLQNEMNKILSQIYGFQSDLVKLNEKADEYLKRVLEQETIIAELRVFAQNDEDQLEMMHQDIQESDNTLQQLKQDLLHQKLMGKKSDALKELKSDKLLNKAFKLYGSHLTLTLEEKLNLFERELIQVYKRKYKSLKDQIGFMEHEQESTRYFMQTLRDREKTLEDVIKELKFKISSLESMRFKENTEHIKQLNEVEENFYKEKEVISREYISYQNMSVIEMGILDNTITILKEDKAKLEDQVRDLQFRLKIPRLHYKFLEENGTLDEFVAAKMEDKDTSEILSRTIEAKKKTEREKYQKMTLSSIKTAPQTQYSENALKTHSKWSTGRGVVDREFNDSKASSIYREKIVKHANKTGVNFYTKQNSPTHRDLFPNPSSQAERSIINILNFAKSNTPHQQSYL